MWSKDLPRFCVKRLLTNLSCGAIIRSITWGYSSVGQSASLTSKRSPVRTQIVPPNYNSTNTPLLQDSARRGIRLYNEFWFLRYLHVQTICGQVQRSSSCTCLLLGVLIDGFWSKCSAASIDETAIHNKVAGCSVEILHLSSYMQEIAKSILHISLMSCIIHLSDMGL